jgi:hypothetical protein
LTGASLAALPPAHRPERLLACLAHQLAHLTCPPETRPAIIWRALERRAKRSNP